MIRTWCKDHPIQFMACYLVFYLAFFKLLEQGIQVPDLVLHCRLDDLIPFCKYAIIPLLPVVRLDPLYTVLFVVVQ